MEPESYQASPQATRSSPDSFAASASALSPPLATPADRPTAAGSTQHLAFLDGLRALAALWVVVHHADENIWLMKLTPPSWFLPVHWAVSNGHFAVSLFIVISGFCLMLPVVRRGAIDGGAMAFYKRRVRRIIPPYYLALAFTLLLIFTVIGKKTGGGWDFSIPPTRSGILTHLLLLQNWSPFFHPDYSGAAIGLGQFATMTPEAVQRAVDRMTAVMSDATNINGPTWTVAVEFQIYLLFPGLVLLWRSAGPAWTVAIASLTYLFYFKYHTLLNTIMSPHYLSLFTLGMLAAQISYGPEEKWRRLRGRKIWGPAALTLVALVVGAEALTQGFVLWFPYVMDVLVGPACMCLLVVAARSREGRLHRLLSAPRLVFIGTFSYSIYLLHAPLLQVLLQYAIPSDLDRVLRFALLAVPGAVFICLVSFGFHVCCEKPFLNSRPRRREGRAALEVTTG
jgi:peptidoglycan/LPS O-acetylase OafA/YrhL